jgi:hypothetical protein
MKKIILLLVLVTSFLVKVQGQTFPHPNSIPIDSIKFTFGQLDSSIKKLSNLSINGRGIFKDSVTITLDTTKTQLWKIGHTAKIGFIIDSPTSFGVMTDTLNPYPPNANDGFTLKFIHAAINPVIELWHEYSTDAKHAGGIIEFSTDSGITWLNIINCTYLYLNSYSYYHNDTLLSGDFAFTGSSNGQQHSQYQLINCMGEKSTNTKCFFYDVPSLFIRFRFKSDSVSNNSYPGWKIDSIRVVSYSCIPGSVPTIGVTTLNITPNPSHTGIFNFPDLQDAHDCTITIYDSRGARVRSTPYQTRLDLNGLPLGLYFYQVSGSKQYYSGKLLYE